MLHFFSKQYEKFLRKLCNEKSSLHTLVDSPIRNIFIAHFEKLLKDLWISYCLWSYYPAWLLHQLFPSASCFARRRWKTSDCIYYVIIKDNIVHFCITSDLCDRHFPHSTWLIHNSNLLRIFEWADYGRAILLILVLASMVTYGNLTINWLLLVTIISYYYYLKGVTIFYTELSTDIPISEEIWLFIVRRTYH